MTHLKTRLLSLLIVIGFVMPLFAQPDIDAKIERVKSLISRAQPIVEKSGNERAAALLKDGIANFRKAVNLRNENKLREANALLDRVAETVNKAVQLANQNNNDIDTKIRKVKASIDRAKPVIEKSTNERAKALFKDALAKFDRAVALRKENKIREANALLDKTIDLINQAVRLANQNNNSIDKMIERVGNEIERAKKIVRESGNERAAQVLREAITHFDKAKRLNAAGKPREAAAELEVTTKLVTKAIAIANGNNPTNLEKMIKRVGAEIEKAKKIVKRSGNERAQQVLDKGIEHYRKALAFYKNGNERACAAQLKITTKLVAKAIAIARGNNPDSLDKAIKRLGERIERAERIVKESGNRKAMKVLKLGIEHYNKAIRFNKAGKKREAAAQLKVASKLVARAVAIANGGQ